VRLIRRVMLVAIVGGAVRALLARRRTVTSSGDDGWQPSAGAGPAAPARSWPDEAGGLETEGPTVGDEDLAAAVAYPEDATLLDRVRSELFRDPALPKGRINVGAANGVVELRGAVEPALIEDIGIRVAAVEGVVRVENLLHAPDPPDAAGA
jgi:BON domain-containing protein